jgi:hypothetical protein
MEFSHRYRKTKNRLLKVCYVPAASARLPRLLFFFFDVAVKSTNEATWQAVSAIKQSIYLDVYEFSECPPFEGHSL